MLRSEILFDDRLIITRAAGAAVQQVGYLPRYTIGRLSEALFDMNIMPIRLAQVSHSVCGIVEFRDQDLSGHRL